MPPDWSCFLCTYRHEAKESTYLTCAVCSSPKPTAQSKVQRAKRQGNLWEHFGSTRQPSQRSAKRPRSSITTTAHQKTIFDVLKPRHASSFAPRARYRDHGKEAWRDIEKDEDIPKLCPMTVLRDVLPSSVASKLLDQLEAESSTWNRGNWIIHGKEYPIPRTTATYNLTLLDDPGGEWETHNDGLHVEDDEENEYLDQKRPISDELRQAANCIAELVQRHCPWPVTTENASWEPTFAFANRYANGKECVGWHADHLTPLGPRPIIVGLSLGACRRFDLRQQQPSSLKSIKKEDECRRHVSVPLPHNSVCIMWNDAQESWQHSIPRCSDDSILQHPKAGPVRISLTFRKRRQLLSFGNCHCGRPAGLKAKEGKYFLFCRPYGKEKSKTCMFWEPCPWAEEEAKRLTIQLEKASGSDE